MQEILDTFTPYDEAIGTTARSFAAFKAGLSGGKILWIPATRDRGQVFAQGLSRFLNIQDLTLVTDLKTSDALWTAEQALRSGAVTMVVLELLEVYSLTQSRRLKLALEAGNANLTAILPIAATQTSTSAYTRWSCEPLPPQDLGDLEPKVSSQAFLQRWNLIKNKKGTLKYWILEQNAYDQKSADPKHPQAPFALSVVSLPSGRGANTQSAEDKPKT